MKVGLAIVERRDMQYLYADGDDLVFMDLQSYEQLHVPSAILGDAAGYLVEGGSAQVVHARRRADRRRARRLRWRSPSRRPTPA